MIFSHAQAHAFRHYGQFVSDILIACGARVLHLSDVRANAEAHRLKEEGELFYLHCHRVASAVRDFVKGVTSGCDQVSCEVGSCAVGAGASCGGCGGASCCNAG